MKRLKGKIKKKHIVLFVILVFFLFPVRASWLLNLDSDEPIEIFSLEYWNYNSSTHTYQEYLSVDDPADKAELKQILNKWYVHHMSITHWVLWGATHPAGAGGNRMGIRCGNKVLAVNRHSISTIPRYGIEFMYHAYGREDALGKELYDYWYRMEDKYERISEPKEWKWGR